MRIDKRPPRESTPADKHTFQAMKITSVPHHLSRCHILVTAFFLAVALPAWAMNPPPTLLDELTGEQIRDDTRNLVICVHGWNPDPPKTNKYTEETEWSELVAQLRTTLKRQTAEPWSLLLYRWEAEAATGLLSWDEGIALAQAYQAAINAGFQGDTLGPRLPNSVRRVHFIAHSAGSWLARQAAKWLIANRPYVMVQVTLLDPFIPAETGAGGTFSRATMSEMARWNGSDRLSRLENYYADDSLLSGWNCTRAPSFTLGTQSTFDWRGNDINQEVDWGAIVVAPLGAPCTFYRQHYDWHSGPITFYRDTVWFALNSTQGTPAGLDGAPYAVGLVGWPSSLFEARFSMPQFDKQPVAPLPVVVGTTVPLSVTARRAHSFQWYRNKQPIREATTASYSFVATEATKGEYVVRAIGAGGMLFSDAVEVTLASSSPSSFTINPSSGPNGSIMPASAFSSSAGSAVPLQATPNAGFEVAYWYVNGLQAQAGGAKYTIANLQSDTAIQVTFRSTVTGPITGDLLIYITPPEAVKAGAQWRIVSPVVGNYQMPNVPFQYLGPGRYQINFKPVSGYLTPPDQTVDVVAGLTSDRTGTYTPVTPSSYTLTLNSGAGDRGYIVNQPFGSGTGHTYDAGASVQLTATPNYGYHFVGWGGDLNGTANPTTITMNGDKTVWATFAPGDDRMGTLILTIDPPEAAAAGVRWGWNADDYRDSGTSVTSFPGTFIFTIHPVDGWLGPSQKTATITAGQTTNVTVTFTRDMTPGFLTVTISPPAAVTAGARWRLNDGPPQGNGASLSLPPGSGYTVTFDSVPGWTPPPNRTVTVSRSKTTVVNGTYTPPVGEPVIGSVYPAIGPLEGGTLLTISGVNFAAPGTVLVGRRPATDVSIVSATQITCLTPAGAVYGSTDVVVQTPGGSATNLSSFAYGISRGSGFDMIASFGGRAYGIGVQGKYAYVGQGLNLLVMDISVPASPSKVGRLQLPGIVQDVAIFGQYAYVADGDRGLQVVDISTPAEPVLRGFHPSTNWTAAIEILGGRAYVGGGGGLDILDLADPTRPSLLSSTNCGPVNDVVVRSSGIGVFAYVSTATQVRVVDVSNPHSPFLRGSIAGDGVYSVAVADARIFAASYLFSGLRMIDAANPDVLVDLGRADGVASPMAVTTANNLVYTVDLSDAWGFYVYSVGGNVLSRVGHVAGIGSTGWHMVASANHAYIAAGASGLAIVGVSNPASPFLVARYNDSGLFGDHSSAATFSHYLYTAGGEGLRVIDVADPAQPSVLTMDASLSMSSSFGRILVAGGHAILVDNGGVRILNLATPEAPVLVPNSVSSTTIDANDGAILGNYLVLVGSDRSSNIGKLVTFDISSPSSPVQRGVLTFSPQSSYDPAVSVAASLGKAVVGMASGAVKVIDTSSMASLVERGQVTNMGFPRGLAMSADGDYAYALDANENRPMRILDVRNPSNPTLVTNIPLGSRGWRLEMRGSELYAGTGKGLYVFDTSSPTRPTLKRSYLSQFYRPTVALPGLGSASDRLFLATGDGGIVALTEQDIEAPDVFITNPIFPALSPVYTNTTSTLSLGGGASDNIGVTRVLWSNDRGGGDEVTPPFENWYVKSISLQPGTNVLTVTAFDAAGNRGSDTLTVIYEAPKLDQTITFPAVADRMFGDLPLALSAAASSGLPVSFSVISGPASLSDNTLSLLGAGTVTVQASQLGNEAFNPAPTTNVTFSVGKAEQAIAFAALPDKSAGDPPFALSATVNSGLAVYFEVISGPAVLDGNVVTLLGGGEVKVSAWQPGNSNYNAAMPVQHSFEIVKLAQTISFGPLSRQTVGDAPFPLAATASSDLPVGFTLIDGPALLNGNIVTVTGPGLVVLRASQPGNARYAAALDVDQVLIVGPGNNMIADAAVHENGTFVFRFYGDEGTNYVAEYSIDLSQWTPLSGNAANGLGYWEFIDADAALRPVSFYRVRSQ